MSNEITKAKELNPAHESLYKGRGMEHLSYVAPYLFTFNIDDEFGQWYMKNGWGQSWGIFVHSYCNFKTLVNHFRHFLIIKTEDGEKMYFRFYDPRVFRVFISTCNKNQLTEIFCDIENYICEDENPDFALKFYIKKDLLETEKITREQAERFQLTEQKRKHWFF